MVVRRMHGRPRAECLHLYSIAAQLDQYDGRRQLRALLFEGLVLSPQTVAGLVGGGSPWLPLAVLTRITSLRHSLEQLAEINPGNEPVLTVVLLARALAEVGQLAKAESLLHRAAAARPDQILLLDALAKLLERQGRSRLNEAIGYYRAARVLRPNLGVALSEALLSAKKLREAEDVARELAQRNRAHTMLVVTTLLAQNKVDDAQSVLLQALENTPDDPGLHFGMGVVLDAQKKDKAAEAAYRKATTLNPAYGWAYIGVGNALKRQGRHREEEETLRKAIDVQPDFAQAHNNLGSLLIDQRKYSEAETAILKAIKLEPEFVLAHKNLSTILLYQNKNKEAELAIRKAIELKPDLADAWYNLGHALSRQ